MEISSCKKYNCVTPFDGELVVTNCLTPMSLTWKIRDENSTYSRLSV